MMRRGEVELTGDAGAILNRYAFFGVGLALNFQRVPAALLGCAAGRVQA
jgi:hypothetical protein